MQGHSHREQRAGGRGSKLTVQGRREAAGARIQSAAWTRQGQEANHKGQSSMGKANKLTMDGRQEGAGAHSLKTEGRGEEVQGHQTDHGGKVGTAVAAKWTTEGRREGEGACTQRAGATS